MTCHVIDGFGFDVGRYDVESSTWAISSNGLSRYCRTGVLFRLHSPFLLFLEYIFIAKQDHAKTKTPSLQLKGYLDNDKPI